MASRRSFGPVVDASTRNRRNRRERRLMRIRLAVLLGLLLAVAAGVVGWRLLTAPNVADRPDAAQLAIVWEPIWAASDDVIVYESGSPRSCDLTPTLQSSAAGSSAPRRHEVTPDRRPYLGATGVVSAAS